MNRRALAFAVAAIVVLILVIWLASARSAAGACNVAYVKLHGSMYTYGLAGATSSPGISDESRSEDITAAIRAADGDLSTDAIVLEVDSPGGSPVAGEEIADALKAAHKSTVALIRDEGDSAAYLAASGAQKIFASAFSLVGDIGVTASYVDTAQENAKNGDTFHQLSVGKYKDMMNPDKPLTPEEQALEMKQLDLYYQTFVNEVAANRNLSADKVTALADGESFTGREALDNGLIDAIGSVDDVRTYLSKQLHKSISVCGIDQ